MSDIAAVGEKRVFEPFDKEAFKKEILNRRFSRRWLMHQRI